MLIPDLVPKVVMLMAFWRTKKNGRGKHSSNGSLPRFLKPTDFCRNPGDGIFFQSFQGLLLLVLGSVYNHHHPQAIKILIFPDKCHQNGGCSMAICDFTRVFVHFGLEACSRSEAVKCLLLIPVILFGCLGFLWGLGHSGGCWHGKENRKKYPP